MRDPRAGGRGGVVDAIENREEKKKENGEPEPRRKEREVDLGRSKQKV